MLTFAAGAAAAIGLLGLALRRKLRRDGIYQGGVRVGSALPAEAVAPNAGHARFAIIRGEPGFREREPFVHGGSTFRIVSAAGYDDRSPVLRRYLDVACEVIGPGG